jgi:hypothetical protein
VESGVRKIKKKKPMIKQKAKPKKLNPKQKEYCIFMLQQPQ